MSVDGNLFDVQNVSVVFQIGGLLGGVKLVAVNDVSFTLSREKAEIFTIAGESGSGKTTLSRLLLGDLHPTSGKVFFEGRDLSEFRSRAELKSFIKKVQPVFQNPFETFNPLRRVEAYLFDTAINFGVANNVKEAAMVVDHALQQVGLSLAEVSKRYPHELSGGQIQRISIARALIPRPRVILADEPVSMVDASLRMEIVNLFRTLRDEEKVSVIYITHDLATAYYISDRIAIMLRGNIVEAGPVEEVLERPMHPYSQLLKESVPEPEPEEKDAWVKHISLGVTEVNEYNQVGCKFAGRCPHVMDVCRQADPPNISVGPRTVKCYLYTEQAREAAGHPEMEEARK
ncbi:oligopeptide/dipeptide ABC transporter, ATP-binding protein, C-terminal domain [Anaerolinea thermolimosa]|uniref:ABC transporter ATP-binding protein n=1 Tax=Anaerolinea thermolimosa TaxID=229919 RepID=UPI0007808647|nr:ABC transporter ATP-binding protein [Anaerolinea thermolimosa]GAP06401.1 oligopeptide/dipeptide ABC transporter, ATP-binding protein, C-terminal domain [Anaerolinea thermolimosa]